jgi:hypothetical protein
MASIARDSGIVSVDQHIYNPGVFVDRIPIKAGQSPGFSDSDFPSILSILF